MIYISALMSIILLVIWQKYKHKAKPIFFTKNDIVICSTTGDKYQIISVNKNQHLLKNLNKNEVISIGMTESSPFHLECK